MAVLTQATEILSSSTGSTVYHFLILVAAGVGLWMAWGEWRRARRERARRWLVATGGIAGARLIFVLASLSAWLGWIDPTAFLPPMERAADLVGAGFLAWALLPWPLRRSRGWNWFFGLNLVLAIAAYVILTMQWAAWLPSLSSPDYNVDWQTIVWAVWEMALVGLGMLFIVRDRSPGWGMFLPAMVLLFAGTLIQLVLPPYVLHLPLWQRAANVIAYVLVAFGIYQDAISGLRLHSREMQDISQASLQQIRSLLRVFDACQQLSSSLDMPAVLNSAVRGIARILRADECAIVVPDARDAGTMRLLAIHNPSRQGRGESVTFPLEYQLTVQQAMRRRKPVIVEASDNVQLKVLFALLGSAGTGPLLVQPLLTDTEAIGAVIAGNSVSQRMFSPDEIKLSQSMALHLVSAISNARLYQVALEEIGRLNQERREVQQGMVLATEENEERADRLSRLRTEAQELRTREEAAREARNALEIQLASSRAEVEALTERLMVLETDLAQAHARVEAQSLWYESESARMRTEWDQTVSSIESSQNILYGMTAGMLLTDEDAVIQDANFSAEILLNRSLEELQQLSLQDISPDERWQQAVKTAGSGEAVRLTTQIGLNTIMCDLAPLVDPEGLQDEKHRVIVIMQDVSTEIAEQRSQLESMASLAHELRTPVTTILSYTDMILSEAVGMVGSAQRKYLTRIKNGAERMASITDDMTRQAGLEEPWGGSRRQPVDVSNLIQATVEGSHRQLEDRELSLELKLPEDLPPVQTDPDHLRHALSHLLSNACLASTVGGQVLVQVTQSATAPLDGADLPLNSDGFLVVSVQDSGGGLSEGALARVFDRERPSRSPAGLGESGAELSLARALVEAHGGRVWVETEKDVGTTFSLVLPIDRAAADRDGLQDVTAAEAESPGEPGEDGQ